MKKTNALNDPWQVRSGFTGTVVLADWILDPATGKQLIGFHGTIRVLSDAEIVGFEAKGHNTANWVLRIEGPTSSVNVLGCQVRAVFQTHVVPITLDYRVVA